MSKLSIILGCILSLTACNKQTAVVVAPTPTKLAGITCNQVYQHILLITYQEYVDPDRILSPEQRDRAMLDVHAWFYNNGITDRFLRSCNTYMTVSQIECAMRAEHLHDITVCVKQGK